jgi:hypothetical protein
MCSRHGHSGHILAGPGKGGVLLLCTLICYGPAYPKRRLAVDASYAAPQAHGIVNVALHLEYSPGIIFMFSQWRKYLYHD